MTNGAGFSKLCIQSSVMKKIPMKYCLILIFIFSNLISQNLVGQLRGPNNIATKILNADFLDKSGNSLTDVKGSPFISESWDQAYLHLASGGKVYAKKTKFNGYTGELHYIDEKGVELAPIDGSVIKVDILDPKDSTKILRKYIAFEDQSKNNRHLFFEAHNEGAVQFVTRQEKFIFTENYDPLKGKTEQYFKTTLLYAIASEGRLTFINDISYENISRVLPKKKQEGIDKKTKLKSIQDVVRFLNQYNITN